MHDRGGLLDVVAAQDNATRPTVDVIDVGLSDHLLLRWAVPLVRPRPVYTTVTRRSWRQLDADVIRSRLSASTLCRPEAWPEFDVDGQMQLYNDEITAVLDCPIPVCIVRSCRRPSDPWFDDEYREAKRHTRRLECAARRTSDTDAAATASALWITQRQVYRDLLHCKFEAFWTAKVDAKRSSPTQLWRSVDTLLAADASRRHTTSERWNSIGTSR